MYYQMKLDSANNEYIVSDLILKGIDRTKMKDEVVKYQYNIWICKSKKRLISYAEELREKQIKESTELLNKLKNRAITVNTRGELIGEGKAIRG